MRMTPKLVSVSILALSLAACGSDAPADAVDVIEDVEDPAAIDAGDEVVLDGEADGETIAEEGDEEVGAADEEADELAPEPEPAAAPAPKPEPAPVPVAAATAPPMFAICSACHSVKAGENGLGPSLAGVGGAKAGHVSAFSYSDAMNESGLTWNAANLDKFLKDPSGTVSGTSMGYGGLRNDAQRKAVVDYLMGL